MTALAIDIDEITTFGNVIDHGLFQIELVTQLVEIGHVQTRTDFNLAGSRLQIVEHQLEQRGLAGTVGTEQTDTVFALQDHGEILDQGRPARMSEADVLKDHDLLAGFLGSVQLNVGLAGAFTALAALYTQLLERPHATFVTGTTSLDALTDPDFFLSQTLVEQCVGGLFGGQCSFLVNQKLA